MSKWLHGALLPAGLKHLSKEQGSERNAFRLLENILIYLFPFVRPDCQSGWAYWPVSQHMLSWELGITQADSSAARKDVPKELEIISQDYVLFHNRRGEHRVCGDSCDRYRYGVTVLQEA